MSIHWTFVKGYLYFEIAVVFIMMLPIFSPRKWNQFFKSRLFSMFQQNAAGYFYILLFILCMFQLDSVREIRKYSHSHETSPVHLAAEMKGGVKLFRAQRNFYITGFSIFLAFVIRKLVTMLIFQDELSIKAQKIIQDAECTVKLSKTTMVTNSIKQKIAEEQLEIEQKRVKELEEEVLKWKNKYLGDPVQEIFKSKKRRRIN